MWSNLDAPQKAIGISLLIATAIIGGYFWVSDSDRHPSEEAETQASDSTDSRANPALNQRADQNAESQTKDRTPQSTANLESAPSVVVTEQLKPQEMIDQAPILEEYEVVSNFDQSVVKKVKTVQYKGRYPRVRIESTIQSGQEVHRDYMVADELMIRVNHPNSFYRLKQTLSEFDAHIVRGNTDAGYFQVRLRSTHPKQFDEFQEVLSDQFGDDLTFEPNYLVFSSI